MMTSLPVSRRDSQHSKRTAIQSSADPNLSDFSYGCFD